MLSNFLFSFLFLLFSIPFSIHIFFSILVHFDYFCSTLFFPFCSMCSFPFYCLSCLDYFIFFLPFYFLIYFPCLYIQCSIVLSILFFSFLCSVLFFPLLFPVYFLLFNETQRKNATQTWAFFHWVLGRLAWRSWFFLPITGVTKAERVESEK